MNARSYILFLLILSAFTLQGKSGAKLYAQDTVSEQTEVSQNIQYADDYLKHRSASVEKYLERNAKIQQQLLTRLNHTEHGLSALSGKSDSLPEYGYARHTIDFDSIQKLARNPSSLYNKGSPKAQKLIDSLKGIQAFIQQQSGRLQQAANLSTTTTGTSGDYSAKLNELQQQLNAQHQIQQLIEQRSRTLQQQFPGKNIPALHRISKQIAIAKAKTQSWKHIADEPDATEAKAFEYLQGVKGFNNYLNTDEQAFGGLGNNPSVEDLQRMGYQTKGMVGQALQKQFGGNFDKARQQLSQQLSAYQKELSKATDKANEAKSLFGDTKKSATHLKHSLQHIQKPAFRNPIRGVPFLLRWQPRYDFQTTRAMDSRPAMLNLSAGLAYKQTPKLKMGMAIAADIGLGKDWQHLKLSYEGISLRAFADYEMIFGIAIEGGYERAFRPANRPYLQNEATDPTQTEANSNIIQKAFGNLQQAAYLGLGKSYHLNKKWNGTFMLGYNFLYQKYGLRTPLMIRVGWEK